LSKIKAGNRYHIGDERINMKNNRKDSTVEVKKAEAILFQSRGDNKKGHPILKDSGKKAIKGDQFVIAGAKVTRADGGKKVQFIGNNGDPLYVDKEDVKKKKNGVQVYTVKKDDTLSGIAQKYYENGDEAHYMKIFDANRHVLKDSSHIDPDQKLIIPKL